MSSEGLSSCLVLHYTIWFLSQLVILKLIPRFWHIFALCCLKWHLRLLRVFTHIPHILHLKGFLVVCTVTCLLSSYDVLNAIKHWVHLCVFTPARCMICFSLLCLSIWLFGPDFENICSQSSQVQRISHIVCICMSFHHYALTCEALSLWTISYSVKIFGIY